MAYIPNVNDRRVLTQQELSALLATSTPSGDKQINGIKGLLLRGNKLSITGDSYLYGTILTALTLARELTTNSGNLVLNPIGPSVDFSGKTLINVGGISGNADRYEIISPGYVTTVDATPTVILTIPTTTGFTYSITTDIAVANNTDGTTSGGITLTTKSGNAAGTAVSELPYIRFEKGAGVSLASITAAYTDSGASIEVLATGVAATTIKWLAAAKVTRSSLT